MSSPDETGTRLGHSDSMVNSQSIIPSNQTIDKEDSKRKSAEQAVSGVLVSTWIKKLQENPADTPTEQFLNAHNHRVVKKNEKNGHAPGTGEFEFTPLVGQFALAHKLLDDYAETDGRQRKAKNHAKELQTIHEETLEYCTKNQYPKKFAWPYQQNHEDGIGGNARFNKKIDPIKAKEVSYQGEESTQQHNSEAFNGASHIEDDDDETDDETDEESLWTAQKAEIDRINGLKHDPQNPNYELVLDFEREGKEIFDLNYLNVKNLSMLVHPDRLGPEHQDYKEKATEAQSRVNIALEMFRVHKWKHPDDPDPERKYFAGRPNTTNSSQSPSRGRTSKSANQHAQKSRASSSANQHAQNSRSSNSANQRARNDRASNSASRPAQSSKASDTTTIDDTIQEGWSPGGDLRSREKRPWYQVTTSSNDPKEDDLVFHSKAGFTCNEEKILAFIRIGRDGCRLIVQSKDGTSFKIKSGSQCGGKLIVNFKALEANDDIQEIGKEDQALLDDKSIPHRIIGAARLERKNDSIFSNTPATYYWVEYKDERGSYWHCYSYLGKKMGSTAARAWTARAENKFNIVDPAVIGWGGLAERVSELRLLQGPKGDPSLYQDLGRALDTVPSRRRAGNIPPEWTKAPLIGWRDDKSTTDSSAESDAEMTDDDNLHTEMTTAHAKKHQNQVLSKKDAFPQPLPSNWTEEIMKLVAKTVKMALNDELGKLTTKDLKEVQPSVADDEMEEAD